jgi:hypothetical protein
MKLIMALVDLLNGKKLNTGTIMVIAVVVLKQFGLSEGEANTIATNIMMGTGGVLALWGYIHRLIKARKPANK